MLINGLYNLPCQSEQKTCCLAQQKITKMCVLSLSFWMQAYGTQISAPHLHVIYFVFHNPQEDLLQSASSRDVSRHWGSNLQSVDGSPTKAYYHFPSSVSLADWISSVGITVPCRIHSLRLVLFRFELLTIKMMHCNILNQSLFINFPINIVVVELNPCFQAHWTSHQLAILIVLVILTANSREWRSDGVSGE